VASLPQGEIFSLANEWVRRLEQEVTRFPAAEIYGGRTFQEAVISAELLGAKLMIVSAGLGFIAAEQQVPPYACTVLVNAPDSIGARVGGRFSASLWWEEVNRASPFAKSIRDAISGTSGLICAALSDAYIEMIAGDFAALPEADRARLRLFTRAPISRIAPALRPFVMPYDDRLDGPDSPIRGTRGDFANRALRHFVEAIAGVDDCRSVEEHASAIRLALNSWRLAERVERIRHHDDRLLALMRHHWDEVGGSSSRLLRHFRDHLNVACEQGRFAALARQVRAERA